MSRWFRHYAGMMRDGKLVSVALKSEQPIERVLWVWGAILESAAEINDNGKFTLDTAEAAYFLRAEQIDLDRIVGTLQELGRIAKNRVVRWGDRQFSSDRSADRTRTYRARRKGESALDPNVTATGDAVTVTSQPSHSDAPELDTELDTETEKKEKKDSRSVAVATRPSESPFEEFWKAYPKREGSNPKQPARKKYLGALRAGAEASEILAAVKRFAEEERKSEHIGTPYVPQALTWLNQQRWGDYAQSVAADSTGPPQPPDPSMPSDAELRAKYAKIQAERQRPGLVEIQEPEDAGVLREGAGAHPGNGQGVRH